MSNPQTGLSLSLLALPAFAVCAAPNEIEALRAQQVDIGLQLYSGAFSLPASEDGICFATYYDVSASVPSDVRVPCGDRAPGQECFTFQRRELAILPEVVTRDFAGHKSPGALLPSTSTQLLGVKGRRK